MQLQVRGMRGRREFEEAGWKARVGSTGARGVAAFGEKVMGLR